MKSQFKIKIKKQQETAEFSERSLKGKIYVSNPSADD